mmetsp:Transcript_53573/g.160336  ORF Transcript_53573/g.160336 Transcript_53573/m.160336 type:complete len:117 (-) Transcript_53573:253-603(-)
MSWRGLSNDFTTRLRSNMKSLPKPLASKGEWTAFLDEETTGLIYYFNSKTGESVWEAPTSSFPEIKLTSDNKILWTTKDGSAKSNKGSNMNGNQRNEQLVFLGTSLGNRRKSPHWS